MTSVNVTMEVKILSHYSELQRI